MKQKCICKLSSHFFFFFILLQGSLTMLSSRHKRSWLWEKWQCMRTKLPHPPTKINDWTAIHNQKHLWKTSRACLGNFSNTHGTTTKSHKRRKRTSFCLHYYIPQAGTVQCQEETLQLERVPLTRKEKLRWTTSL